MDDVHSSPSDEKTGSDSQDDGVEAGRKKYQKPAFEVNNVLDEAETHCGPSTATLDSDGDYWW